MEAFWKNENWNDEKTEKKKHNIESWEQIYQMLMKNLQCLDEIEEQYVSLNWLQVVKQRIDAEWMPSTTGIVQV
jgi:hypothetical protein